MNRKPVTRVQTPWAVFRIPLLLATVSVVGLVAALLVDGAIDALWAAAVAVPLVVVLLRMGGPARSRTIRAAAGAKQQPAE